MSDTHVDGLRELHENLCAALATAIERDAMEESLGIEGQLDDLEDQIDDIEGQWDNEIGHGESILDYPGQDGPTEADL